MVRALQERVNERTRSFEAARPQDGPLGPEEKLQLGILQRKQKEVEAMLQKLRDAVGER